MVLIYTTAVTARLQYACSFIFKELLAVDVVTSNEVEQFKQHTGPKINYSGSRITTEELWIQNVPLLFEKGIQQQEIHCFEGNGYTAFFQSPANSRTDFPFDIFAATFYLLSRYEEYLPYQKDMYGRYGHDNALAFKEGFLKIPVIQVWVNDLVNTMHQKFTAFTTGQSSFSFLPTYDIDIAFSYKHKGFERTLGGFLKSPTAERLRVITGAKPDPFDAYAWMDALHRKYALEPLYFFLMAAKNSKYDKNILPTVNAMQQLIKEHAANYNIGIHPSWQSGDKPELLKKEIGLLEGICKHKITASRQHYIRFELPAGYRRLLAAGITDDYSMGYGSINGFKASVAASFYWYDLEKEEQTALRVHPFCFMDANSFYEQQVSAAQAYDELMHYYRICKEVNGKLISIWHNNFLGHDRQFAGWKECYEQFIRQLPE
jgi:hypothetical protein